MKSYYIPSFSEKWSNLPQVNKWPRRESNQLDSRVCAFNYCQCLQHQAFIYSSEILHWETAGLIQYLLLCLFIHLWLYFLILFISLADIYWSLIMCYMLRYIMENPCPHEVLGDTKVYKIIWATPCFRCYARYVSRK